MAAPIDLRNDFDSVSLRRLGIPGTRPRAVVCWRRPIYDGEQDGCVADRRRGLRSFGLGAALQHPRTGRAMGSRRAHPRRSTNHRRALARLLRRPVRTVDGVVRWRRKDLARWLLETFAISLEDHGRALIKALGFPRSRARATTRKTSWNEALKKTSPPNWRRSGRGSRKRDRALAR